MYIFFVIFFSITGYYKTLHIVVCALPLAVFSRSVVFFVTPRTATIQVSLSFAMSLSLLKLMSIEPMMPSNQLILSSPSSCPQSFTASGSFPMSRLFASHGQSTGASASASVFPVNIQGWLPLGWTVSISFLSKALSGVFSSTRAQKHQFWYKYRQCNIWGYTKKKVIF